jgi:hypothetical protein
MLQSPIFLKLKNFLIKDPYNWQFWLIVAFFVKLVVFLIEIHVNNFHSTISGYWGDEGGDTSSYLVPIDNLIHNGVYNPDFRMPGYGIFYLPLALIFPKAVACNMLIMLQMVLCAVSTYLLPLIALELFKKRVFFYVTFFLYLTCIFSFMYEMRLLTESLTTSLLIISVFCFVTYFKNYNAQGLVISGICLTGVVFLRPVFAVLWAFFLILLISNLIKMKRQVYLPVLIFTFFFMVCDGTWILRNYLHYKTISPLTRTLMYPSLEQGYEGSVMKFVCSFGGDFRRWDPRTETHWLDSNNLITFDMEDTVFVLDKDTVFNGKKIPMARGIPFPKDIYTSKFNLDSLMLLRKLIVQYNSQIDTTEMERSAQLKNIKYKLHLYTQSIMDEKPMLYQVIARLRLLRRFLSEASYDFPYVRFTYRIYRAINFAIIGLGIVGIILMGIYIFKLSKLPIIPIIPLWVIFIHPLVLRFDEGRYFVPAFPFMLICAIYAVVWLKEKVVRSKASS